MCCFDHGKCLYLNHVFENCAIMCQFDPLPTWFILLAINILALMGCEIPADSIKSEGEMVPI